MKIEFTLKDDPNRPLGYLQALALPERLYYEAYYADVAFEFDGKKQVLPNVPMLNFVATLQNLLIEAFLTEHVAEALLWDTGLKLSLSIVRRDSVALEIPKGAAQLEYPLQEFIVALKATSFELLWIMYDDAPQLLSEGTLFTSGSILGRAAQMIVQGKVARQC